MVYSVAHLRCVEGSGALVKHAGERPLVVCVTENALCDDVHAGNVARSATRSSVVVLREELAKAEAAFTQSMEMTVGTVLEGDVDVHMYQCCVLSTHSYFCRAGVVWLLLAMSFAGCVPLQRNSGRSASARLSVSRHSALEVAVNVLESRMIALVRQLEVDCILVRAYPHRYSEKNAAPRLGHAVRHAVGFVLRDGHREASVQRSVESVLDEVRDTSEMLALRDSVLLDATIVCDERA